MSATAPFIASAPIRREVVALVTLAAPIIVGKLSLMGQNTVDVLLAGHLSAAVLGAVAMGGAVWWLGQMALAGLMMTVSPFVSQLDGAGRRGEAAAVFVQALWIALIGGVALMLLVRWGGPALVDVMDIAPEMRPDVRTFLHAISWAAPAVGVVTACMGLSEGLSMPRASMVFGMLGLLLLAPLGYVVMYGKLGLPAMGARGSGVANSVVVWAQAAGFLGWIAWSRRFAGLGWRAASWRPDRQGIAAQLRVGVPIAASQLLESGLFTTAGLLIGGFGAAAAASHLVALNVGALTFMVPLGLAFATTIRVGNAVGRADRPGVRRAGFCGIALALGAQAFAAVVLISVPDRIAALYSQDPEVLSRATVLLRLAGIFQLSDGLQVASIAALRGLKDTAALVVITAVSYWGVGLPVALICAYPLGMEAPGIWLGLIAGLTVAAVLLVARFRRVSR